LDFRIDVIEKKENGRLSPGKGGRRWFAIELIVSVNATPRLVSPAAPLTCATILALSGIHNYRFSAGWQ
jgi:hypothetical protein